MKKLLASMLVLVMLFTVSVPAFAYSVNASDFPALQEKMVAVPGLDNSYQFHFVPSVSYYNSHWPKFYTTLQDPSRVSFIYVDNAAKGKFTFVSLPSDFTFSKGVGSTGHFYFSFRSESSNIPTIQFTQSSDGYTLVGANSGVSSILFYRDSYGDRIVIPVSKNYEFDSEIALLNVNQIYITDPDHPLIIPETKTLTINYVYSNGNKAAEPITQALEAGAAYSVASPAIVGYTPDVATVAGTMPGEDLAVTVIYARNVHDLTINYQFADGAQAAPPLVSSMPYGVTFSFPSPELPGYTASLPIVTGNMPDHALTVDVIYSTVPYTLTVQYLFEDGTKAADSVVQALPLATPFSILSPTISGYKPDKAIVKGDMPAWNLLETVTYLEDSSSSSGGSSSGGSGADGGDESSSSPDSSSSPTYDFSNPFDRGNFTYPDFSNPFDRSNSSGSDFSNPFERAAPSADYSNPFARSQDTSSWFSSFDEFFNQLFRK